MKKYAMNDLLETYGKRVYNLAYRLTGNRQDAEDVTQDTFLQVYRGLEGFRGESAIYTWIYRIAVNNSLQVKRKLDKAYIDSLDKKIEQFKEDIPEDVKRWEYDPEKRYLVNELLQEIRRECYHFMTFRLTDEQRVVYILRVVMGFALDDISLILQIDKNTVKARLQRAKSNLNAYFSDRCQWIGEKGSCSCDSRIGFAVAFAPDILKRLRNYSHDEKMKKTVSSSLRQIRNIEEIYQHLPMESYKTDLLASYIKEA
jgi:RNA polymerase sigma-70 factor (ECF subfamily)